MTLDKEKVRDALKSYDDGWTPWRDERVVIVAAARAWLDGQEVGTTDTDKAVAVELYDLCDKWAENDRLWSTQETVELSLRSFAYEVLRLQARPDSDREGEKP